TTAQTSATKSALLVTEKGVPTGQCPLKPTDVNVEGCRGPCETVTVNASSTTVMNSELRSMGLVDLPVSGRDVKGLIFLTPGTVALGHSQPVTSEPVNISVNGQLPHANSFEVDGVSANFGIAPGGQSPGASAGGAIPALTALGSTDAF